VTGIINEFFTIISLKTLGGKAKLCISVGNKINQVLMNIIFVLNGKSPTIMRVIIDHDQIITIAQNTSDR
jgi:hypothetical protein